MAERFVVIGAGTMGVGIAYVAANAGYTVELVEVDPARAEVATRTLTGLWATAVERGKMSTEDAAASGTRVVLETDVAHVADEPAVVVEAVPERADLKHRVLAAAEAIRPALLASNTSSISIAELAAPLARPAGFVGLHFFNPVWAMELVEVVVGPATAEETTAGALRVARRLSKEPITVRDKPGFATSRLGVLLGLEAIRMVEDGVASPADIDGRWCSGTGTRWARCG